MELDLWLIDDDDIQCLLVREFLELMEKPFRFTYFNSAKKALEQLSALKTDAWPHVILLDLFMPHFNGFDFLNAFTLNKRLAQTPLSIYVLTSSILQADRDKVMAYEKITDYLVKPINLTQLTAIWEHVTLIHSAKST